MLLLLCLMVGIHVQPLAPASRVYAFQIQTAISVLTESNM